MKNLLNLTEKEIIKKIENTGFLLYGNYKKEEKKKIIHLFDEYDNDVEFHIQNGEWGRELHITIWALPPIKSEEQMYITYIYTY